MQKSVVTIFLILLAAAGCNRSGTSRQPQPTPTSQSGQSTYASAAYGFQFVYPVAYQVKTIASADAYPELSYQTHISSFQQAIDIRKIDNPDGACSAAQILVYSDEGKNSAQWLMANPTVGQGYGKQSNATVAGIAATLFSSPAGDLVPGNMYILDHDGYIIQINTNESLSGVTPTASCFDVLSALQFNGN